MCDHSEASVLSTSFIELDKVITGLQNSDLIVVAARYNNVGGISFALNLIEHTVITQGLSVALFDMEHSNEKIYMRLISLLEKIDLDNLKSEKISERTKQRVQSAKQLIKNKHIFIDDTPGITASYINSKIEMLSQQQAGIDLVIVNKLQLMSGNKGYDDYSNRSDELSEITKDLKEIAQKFSIPVVVMSDVYKAVEFRPENHRPTMADLEVYGSGIKEYSDVVILIYRDELYYGIYGREHVEMGTAELIIAKNKYGARCTVNQLFQAEYGRFDENA